MPSRAESIRVLFVDDHQLFREGIRLLLSVAPDIEIVRETGDGDDLLHLLREDGWDVLILDLCIPGFDGLDLIERAKIHQPQRPVLVLTMCAEDLYGIRALRAGADGYLHKDVAASDLVDAIRRVAGGRKYVSPDLAGRLADLVRSDGGQQRHEALSNREYQVLSQLAAGRTAREIAETLCLSVKTVNTYRQRVMKKLDLENNAQMISYAIHNGLVE